MKITLNQARNMVGLSQKDLSKRIGISLVTYRRLEKDPESATIRQAKMISIALGIPYDNIFFGKEFN